MHIFGDMPGNIISRAGFSQPFVISLLYFLMTASAVAKMALGLLEITENHGSQHLSLVYWKPLYDSFTNFSWFFYQISMKSKYTVLFRMEFWFEWYTNQPSIHCKNSQPSVPLGRHFSLEESNLAL
jgi:hypothetical protein